MNSEDRTQRLLALLLINQMKDTTIKEKAIQLNMAGFTNVEIADLLDSTAASISQFLYEANKEKRAKKPKAKNSK